MFQVTEVMELSICIKVAVKWLQAAAGNFNEFLKQLYLCLHTGSKEDSKSKDKKRQPNNLAE